MKHDSKLIAIAITQTITYYYWRMESMRNRLQTDEVLNLHKTVLKSFLYSAFPTRNRKTQSLFILTIHFFLINVKSIVLFFLKMKKIYK